MTRALRAAAGPLLAVFLAAPLAPLAAAPPVASKARLGLAADRTSYLVGEGVRLAAVLAIDEGWHTNSNRPTFEYLIPTELTLTPPEGWEVVSITYPPGRMETFAFEEQPLSVYAGEAVIVAELAPPPGGRPRTVTLTASARYQACNDRSCLPPTTAEAAIDLEIGTAGSAANAERFARAGDGEAAAQAAAAPSGGRLAVLLLMAVVGGLILNAMPCVLPVLSLKIFGLVEASSGGRSAVVAGSLATASGILVSFWGLAIAAIVARWAGAAVGWGVQFQEPVFVAFLTLVVVLFSLNLWGLFEVPLPAGLARVAGGSGHGGLAGHFGAGLFATLLATPCSAPFLGTALGFALSQPGGTIFLFFTAVGLGMALPYLALAATPRAARLLPRPGAWMLHFKVVMGFLLAAAAVWLLYVLAAQMSSERLAFLQLALLGLALFVWMRSRATARFWRVAGALGIAAAVAATLALAAGAGEVPDSAGEPSSGLISWQRFDRAEAERLAGQGRLVFVDVTADWCFTCKVNERLVLETAEVAELFESQGVVPMKADWTNRSDAIAEFLADHGRYGVPFYLLYRPDGEPHLFPELLTRQLVAEAVEAAAGD